MRNIVLKGRILLFMLMCSFYSIAFSQNTSTEVLFTVGNEKVTVAEFKNVYSKSNVSKSDTNAEASLREYLNLYINFKLKVKEAKALDLGTLTSIKEELNNYRKQLSRSYLSDKEVINKLVREAYDRMQQDIQAGHILIKVSNNALAKDTLEAYKKIIEIKKRLLKGEDFETLAKELSEDPSAKQNGGDLGYFTALQLVYPFETSAYNTPVGEISKPVRTRFGYHLIKVMDKRPSRGKVLAAHIFVKVSNNATAEQEKQAKEKIDDIYERVNKGEAFKELAKQFSDDKNSAKKGGELRWFSAGQMVIEFENAVFALENNGDVSLPVRTKYGWHIIKLIEKKKSSSFEEMEQDLRSKVAKDSRSGLAKDILINRIKSEYNFKEKSKAKDKLYVHIDSSILKGQWKTDKALGMDAALFQLGKTKYSQKEFAKYIEKNPRLKRGKSIETIYNNYYNQFVEKSCIDFEERKLEEKYPEFKELMGEYFEGILLFEITDQKVWSKAVNDTIGLKEFFEKNKDNYIWGDRVKANIFKCKNVKIANRVKKEILKKDIKNEDILSRINLPDDKDKYVTIDSGIFERGDDTYIDQVIWKMGLSKDIVVNDGRVVFVKIIDLLEPGYKLLKEVKGQVIADYQEYLETEWIQSLKKKYPVKIDEKVFNSLVN